MNESSGRIDAALSVNAEKPLSTILIYLAVNADSDEREGYDSAASSIRIFNTCLAIAKERR